MPEDDSRSAILAAAWEVTIETFGMADKPLKPSERASTKMFEQLKTAELARRAGFSTGAFYNRWPTREVFLDDFLDYALSIDRYPGPALLFEVFASMEKAPLAEVLTELSIANAKAQSGCRGCIRGFETDWSLSIRPCSTTRSEKYGHLSPWKMEEPNK